MSEQPQQPQPRRLSALELAEFRAERKQAGRAAAAEYQQSKAQRRALEGAEREQAAQAAEESAAAEEAEADAQKSAVAEREQRELEERGYAALRAEALREQAAQEAGCPANASELRALLEEALYQSEELTELGLETRTYEEAGVLTRDEGLLLRLPNGAEYQLTIVQSQLSREGR